MQELAQNFKLFRGGGESYKLRFYVGHDGTMIRLASALGFGKIAPLRWPALGSEIIMEVSWGLGLRPVRVGVLTRDVDGRSGGRRRATLCASSTRGR